MKNRLKAIVLVIALFTMAFNAYSQTTNTQIIVGDFLGEGELTIGESYSATEIISRMGTPKSQSWEFDVCDQRTFVYDDNVFYTCDGKFNGFKLVNKRYKLNRGIGIGDRFEKIAALNATKIKSTPKDNGVTIYSVYITDKVDDMSPIYFHVIQGIILEISYIYVDDI